MARPRLSPDEKIRVSLNIKLSLEASKALAKIAKANGMASSQYVRSLVHIHLSKAHAYASQSEAS